MNNIQEVTILLPAEEAKKFLMFQQYYHQFSLLVDNGVFNIRNGSAVINFDAYGIITTVSRADMLYNRRVINK